MTTDAAILNRLLDWIGQSMDRIPYFYWLLGVAVSLFVLVVIVRELGRAVSAWRHKE